MSTPDQLQGDSLRRQLAKTRAYADQHGLELIEGFSDLGVSAFRGRNVEFGELSKFMELIRSGHVPKGSYLIVESMDRLSRDKVMTAFGRLSEIMSLGIIVVTLDDGQRYSTETLQTNPYGIMIALGSMTRAHEESRRKAGLLADAWDEKKRAAREEGKILSRRMPAWLRLNDDGKSIVPINARAAVVVEIFELVRDGWGAYSVSRHLNQRGEAAWGGRAKAVWRESYIKKIVGSRTVLGEYHPHRIVHDESQRRRREPHGSPIIGYYPAVVSETLFRDAQLAMSRRRATGRGRKGPQYANLFTGLLRCICGGGYRYVDKGAPPKGGQYLQCSIALAKGPCSSRAFRYQVIEAALLSVVESLDVVAALGGKNASQRIAEKREERSLLGIDEAAVGQKIRHLIQAIETGGETASGRLSARLSELDREEQAIRQQIDRADAELAELLTMDPAEHQRAIAALLTAIRSEDGRAKNEAARRALVGELQRVLKAVEVRSVGHPNAAWELMESDGDWRSTFGVGSAAELQKLVLNFGFEFVLTYRNGDTQHVDGLTGTYFKLKGSRRFNDLRLLRESAGRA